MSDRVLWDAVPAHVRAALQARERPPREGETAIVDAARGERWYFRRTVYGWNHLSTDRQSSNDAVASDLTPEQRAEALRQVEKVERAMRDSFGAPVADAPREPIFIESDARARALADKLIHEAVRRTVQDIIVKVLLRLTGFRGEEHGRELTMVDELIEGWYTP